MVSILNMSGNTLEKCECAVKYVRLFAGGISQWKTTPLSSLIENISCLTSANQSIQCLAHGITLLSS